MKNRILLCILMVVFAALMSAPWLFPNVGFVALFAMFPLLCADAIADQMRMKHFFFIDYFGFVLWNAATTFWVGNATVGGAVFAILCNALQMSIIWGVFRFSKHRLRGILPYVFLVAMWIAWERLYFSVDISWPWLVLGNAFANTAMLAQWYEYTGSLGGSLWIWLANLSLFGFVGAVADGKWLRWNGFGKIFSFLGVVFVMVAPAALSLKMYYGYEEVSEGTVDVIVGQPNFDPYQKFSSYSQEQQNTVLLDLYESELKTDTVALPPVLLLAPETFTSDICLNTVEDSPTYNTFREFQARHPEAGILFGASTYELFGTHSAPSILARKIGESWMESHNSAVMLNADGRYDIFHKSKLVVGTELTPYPEIFVPLDNWLSEKMGVNGLMGRCIGQEKVSLLHFNGVPLGCAVCYESVYGDYCRDYVKEGAKAMTVITNDAWWGDTPGYRQHLNYSRLRAIELRRDIARCANTGISAFINQRGDIVSQSEWWEASTLTGSLNLSSRQTFFVRYGDITGKVCTCVFLLLFLTVLIICLIRKAE